MKTIREWLNELPDGYRELALANEPKRKSLFDNTKESDMASAIASAFLWSKSKEGMPFWSAVQDHFDEMAPPLPPLPNTETQQ